MRWNKVFCLLTVLLFAGMAAAANPVVVVLTDNNEFFPAGSVQQIEWTITDADDPSDVNVQVSYLTSDADKGAKVRINATTDENLMLYCSNPVIVASQTCTLNWTLPADLNGIFDFDVNIFDISNSDDTNAEGTDNIIDTTPCTTTSVITNDRTVTLTAACTGLGAGSSIQWNKSRQGRCEDSFQSYDSPFDLVFGDFTVCYFSTDNLGNIESTTGFTQKFSSNALELAQLVELALAALLLVGILSVILVGKFQLEPTTVVPLALLAITMVIIVIVIATIL